MIASKIREAVLSALRQLKHQVKELRDEIKALKDDNRDFKRQLGNARSSHGTAALLSSRAAEDNLRRVIPETITERPIDVFRGSRGEQNSAVFHRRRNCHRSLGSLQNNTPAVHPAKK